MTHQADGLDPLTALATSMHAQPGVFALLLGSGVSTASGVPTGWGVLRQLVLRAAAASESPLAPDADDAAIEGWWADHGPDEPLGYSALLEALGQTPAMRRALLAGFFEPTDDERTEGIKVPGPAHHAVAELVARGAVRVILTTNFDRLIEQALEARGIFPQVLAGEGAIAAMEPLVHARCTVVKLHGDYASLDQRNTEAELRTYGVGQRQLLGRIFDEYGLIVSGWSADWDYALVAALEESASRRYPLFWAQVGALGAAGARLVGGRRATLASNLPAGELFEGIVTRLQALDDLAAPPMSTAVALARLKRALPNPVRHIELQDLLDSELAKLTRAIEARPSLPPANEPADLEAAHRDLRALTDPLVRLMATGTSLDRDRAHTSLWVRVVQRALRARQFPNGQYQQWWDDLQHYPALLVLRAALLGALAAEHEDVIVALLRKPTWRDPRLNRQELPAFVVLNEYRVLNTGIIDAFPRWGFEGKTKWLYAQSHLLKDDLKSVAVELAGDEESATQLLHGVEYRLALADWLFPDGGRFVAVGEFIGENAWTFPQGGFDGTPWTEVHFRETADPDSWDLGSLEDGGPGDERLKALRVELLKGRRRF